MGFSALVASALCTFLLPLLLFLAAVKLWDLYCVSSRDPSCPLPLPPGTMGLPFFGETLQLVLQVRPGDGAGSGEAPLWSQSSSGCRGGRWAATLTGPRAQVGKSCSPCLFLLCCLKFILSFPPSHLLSRGGNSCRWNAGNTASSTRLTSLGGPRYGWWAPRTCGTFCWASTGSSPCSGPPRCGPSWAPAASPTSTTGSTSTAKRYGPTAGGERARSPGARRLSLCPVPPRPPGQVIMRAFSRDALQHYVPVIQEEVSACLARWLGAAGPCLLVYPEVKRLMFRIAMRILLGFQPRQASPDGEQQLVEAFEEMIRNLFSLPIDVPFSGLYRVRLTAGQQERGAPAPRAREWGQGWQYCLSPKLLSLLLGQGLRARNIIHAKIEENIRAKMARKEPEGGYKDALQLLMEHTQGNGEQLNMQVRFPWINLFPSCPLRMSHLPCGDKRKSRRCSLSPWNKPASVEH